MKLSVCLTTYNHEKFIREAIDSVLSQKTDFEFELLIGEDDSSDNTRAIVTEYKSSNPDKIVLFLHNREDVIYINGRPTGRHNYLNNLRHAKGEYIAVLDGDDFWTDPYKLQKQIDFLDENLDYSASFHNVYIGKDNLETKKLYSNADSDFDLELRDFLIKNQGPTVSLVFRNPYLTEFPDTFYTCPVEDWLMNVFLVQHGKIRFMHEVMGYYRKHDSGVWSGVNDVEKMIINEQCFHAIDEFTQRKYRSILMRGLLYRYLSFSDRSLMHKNYQNFKRFTLSAIHLLRYSCVKGLLRVCYLCVKSIYSRLAVDR